MIIEDNIQLAVAMNDFRATQRCVVSPENKSLAEEMAAAIPIQTRNEVLSPDRL